jgi:hypothetical protein
MAWVAGESSLPARTAHPSIDTPRNRTTKLFDS